MPALSSAYVAIPLSDDSREQLRVMVEQLRMLHLPVRWQSVSKSHITLIYYGEIDEATLPLIQSELKAVARSATPFILNLGEGLDHFGPEEAPRVAWLPIVESAALNRLQTKLNQHTESFIKSPEKNYAPFRPHLTLAKVMQPDRYLESLDKLKTACEEWSVSLQVDKIQLCARSVETGEYQVAFADYPLGQSIE